MVKNSEGLYQGNNEKAFKKTETKEIKKESTEEYSFSEALNKYISYKPLKVDERIVRAASELDIKLSWDDEGKIKDINFIEANKLVQQLGTGFLSPSEYWEAYNEAVRTGNENLLKQFKSKEFTEWLDAVYIKDDNGDVWIIEHPEILEKDNGEVEYRGNRKKIIMPEGRPGWFNPKNNIDLENIAPSKIDLKKEKKEDVWKFWSVFKVNEYVAPIRGYVTSSGTPSYDLDIPVGAKQPVLMIRETRDELPEPALNPELMKKADNFCIHYLNTVAELPGLQNLEEHENFYSKKEELFDFLEKSGNEFMESDNRKVVRFREKFIDMLGVIRVLAKNKGEEDEILKVDNLAKKLFKVDKHDVNYETFKTFINLNKEKLNQAILDKKKIVFVMGHKNPDTDTVISSMVESYRNSLLDEESIYIPIIQSHRIPDEVRKLIGDDLSDSLLLEKEEIYTKAKNSGQAQWILVDQNVSDVQKFTISIVDHHTLSDKATKQSMPLTWEMAGSTTAMVAQKIHGMGLDIDDKLGKILYGATLMDTENRSISKMTYKDGLLMDDLKQTAGVSDDKQLYQELMDYLLNTDDAEFLFGRDYKEDWGFGFAVAKCKGAFDKDGKELKSDLMNRLKELALKNNYKNNYPMTMVKLVDYLDDNETVNRERFYLIFNNYVLPEFKHKMQELLNVIIKKELGEEVNIKNGDDTIDYWGTGKQLSRKKIAPLIEKITDAFNDYYYAESVGLNIKREFLMENDEVKKAALDLGIELSVDEEGKINNITYGESRTLLDYLGLQALSLSEYWQVLKEAQEKNDKQMIDHLQSPGFVEFLDTIIIDKEYIIDHPEIIKAKDGFEFKGEKKKIKIVEAEPGLILPDDIDKESGLPNRVRDPRNYGNKQLWRYWSPDADLVAVTRGHIFLLGQPALDTKIHPDEALPNLGIRPCRKQINSPKIEITEDEKGININIQK